MSWLLLWPLIGLLGWGWMNHMVQECHLAVGWREVPSDPAKWVWLGVSLVIGPVMIILNLITSLQFGEFYWGLRFK